MYDDMKKPFKEIAVNIIVYSMNVILTSDSSFDSSSEDNEWTPFF